MQVYIELAVIENFCMDFTLLYSAKSAVKNPAPLWRIALSAAFGAAFAVLFPIFKLSPVPAVIVKILSGAVICLLGGKYKNFVGYLKFFGTFTALTALLGGALIGIFSLAGTDYIQGGGYLLSSVPIGIPLFGALLVFLFAKRLALKFSKGSKNEVVCRIYAGQSQTEVRGFFDSGNKVYKGGEPVSIIPADAAKKLVDGESIKDGVKIHTVAGSRTIKVFTADRVEINFGDRTQTFDKIKIGISPRRIARAVLHPDLLEE